MPRDQAYLEAEKKIEKARRSGAKEIRLGLGMPGMGHILDAKIARQVPLTQLPESLRSLTQLLSLDIAANRLETLPEWFGDLRQLQVLILCGNQLTALPKSLGQLTQLRGLNLSSNQLTALPEWLGQLTQLTDLDLNNNQLTVLPESLGQLTQLRSLNLSRNQLTALPESLGQLTQLTTLYLSRNQLTTLPESLGGLKQLKFLDLAENRFMALPEALVQLIQLKSLFLNENHLKNCPDWLWNMTDLKTLALDRNELEVLPRGILNLSSLEELWIGENELELLPDELGNSLSNLRVLVLSGNRLTNLPPSLAKLENLRILSIDENPLNPELAEASNQGIEAVKLYLRAGSVVPSYEAKLILVGEGEVGKTCLMDALLDKEWQEHPSTHGIGIQQIKVNHLDKAKHIFEKDEEKIITLNGWDFGGQHIYRPTHQLFFSAPAVYLVVWKPREGPQQSFVKEWIQLVKRREPSAKIIVVATHGGPQQRQPDIDRQELWDIFGKETVVDFFFVDSKPDANGNRKGIAELKRAIARVAAELPEVGRSVPKSFADVRGALQATDAPYLPLDEVLAICRAHNMDDEIARLFITISHRLGHLTHYENDPALRDIVILRPDWLATAMSYVLDDEETRKAHGLVDFSRLGQLWDDPSRTSDSRYPATLHRIFLHLLERFDLSYRVAGLSKDEDSDPVSLIAQLVPDTTPKEDVFTKAWASELAAGDIQQTQICRIVDAANGQSANAEGLFFQLIVRLHKYSLGRVNYNDSVHWQRGLILDDEYNGRALLRHIGNDVHITVRAPYPQRFLAMLTEEVKFLVRSFWIGLNCEITVPCLNPTPCKGLFEVSKLIENKKEGHPQQPCPICNKWQSIDQLLNNVPAASQPISIETLGKQLSSIENKLDTVDVNVRILRSQADKYFDDFIRIFTDEAKEGPRLFSLFPLDGSWFNPKNWIRHQFRLVLWCEHSRLPLPVLNNGDMKKGVYDFELDKEWFKKTAPYLKLVTGTLSLVLPVASGTLKVVDDAATKAFQAQFDLGNKAIDAIVGEIAALNEFSNVIDSANIGRSVGSRAENATLRELHALLKAEDPGFGGLVRVLNKRNEFLWVHEKFAGDY